MLASSIYIGKKLWLSHYHDVCAVSIYRHRVVGGVLDSDGGSARPSVAGSHHSSDDHHSVVHRRTFPASGTSY